LGIALESRYKCTGKVEDLEEAIQVTRQAIKVTPKDRVAGFLSNLGIALESRYKCTRKIEDLEEAIQVTRQAIKVTPKDHPGLVGCLNNLGSRLQSRYECTGKIEDLEEAIQVTQRGIKITPKDHPDLVGLLNNLGIKLGQRYERTGKIEDLEKAIQVTWQAIKATPKNHPDLAGRLGNLGSTLRLRYERTGQIEDLEKAIQVTRQAIEATPKNHPDLAGRLGNLGSTLRQRYERTGQIEDLEKAIQVTRQAIEATPKNHLDLAGLLSNLGIKLGQRYEHTGKIEDLEEAIQVTRQGIKVTPKDHPDLAGLLSNLGNKLSLRYEHTGKIEDLEKAIQVTRQAIELTPKDHLKLGGWLNNLGNKLGLRYERTRKMEDLEAAIQVIRQAVQGLAKDHLDLARWLINLGTELGNRYERTGKIEDLEEAIQVNRQAIKVTPKDHPRLAGWLNNLGNKLGLRYERTGKIEDLEGAIQVTRQAIKLTPKDHLNLADLLNNLGNKLGLRYERTGQIEDLEEAIQVTRQAIEITPKDHPNIAKRLCNLGHYLLSLDSNSKPMALKVLLQAWNCFNAIPFVRIRAATLALQILQDQGNHASAYELSASAIDLLPRVHNRSLSHQDQQYVVSLFSGLATTACSLALQVGKPPEKALEILEQGRGVILSLLIEDRSDTSELKAAYPDLCALYETLRVEVNTPIDIDGVADQRQRNRALNRRSKAIEELNECVQNIRQLPEFGQFQRGLTAELMKKCSAEGCVVVVNVTDIRSDAIVVSTDAFKVIPLSRLDAIQAKDWINQQLTPTSSSDGGPKNKAYLKFLSWLWRGCVKPVLDELHYTVQHSADDLPRTWWIGTGFASSFPFHAAGDYSAGPTESAHYRIISSYSPSIKALIYAREHASTTTPRHDPPKFLVVTMPKTPGASDLPGARIEQSEIVSAMGPVSVETLEQPDVVSVMHQVQQCSIVHFACHGVSHPVDPSESGLLLQTAGTATAEPRQDILSVRKVSQAHLSGAEIAYLSACSTAENRAIKLTDEVLHLVSGFQVAGFRHVVGCLWPSSDIVCVQVAKSFYSRLGRNGAVRYDDRVIALALHEAVVKIKNSDEYRKRPLHWAQYVHFGA
jgi:tetratricopeptide (TPR) repeat protein